MPEPEFPEHRVYVGKPEWFDVLGGRHFMLLFLLGLREHHRLLDFGCGSLRSGRLAIIYLQPDRYFGIDPNRWLIDAALEHEVGRAGADLKRPRFDFNAECQLDVFGVQYDFVHAHSIFTHAPQSMIRRFVANLAGVLAPGGLCVGTFVAGEEDYPGDSWVYPATVTYRRSTFQALVEEVGLTFHLLRWPHPEQTYFVISGQELDLPARLAETQRAFGIDLLG